MKRTGWKGVAVVVILVVVAAWWVARKKGPEQRLAGRYRQLCAIAGDNVKSPSRGVDRMGAFFAANSGEMLRDYAELIVGIERIADDRRHDERAREAGKVLRAPLHECEDTFERFADAVEADDEASAKVTRAFDRLGRTLQLLFGDEAGNVIRRFSAKR